MEKINAVIVGAGGYGGCGSVEILSSHPGVQIVALLDQENIDKPYSDVYPHLRGFCDIKIQPPIFEEIRERVDVVFFATPDGVGQAHAPYWLNRGAKVIDFSGDFRFPREDDYVQYATRIGKKPHHASKEVLSKSVYGLPELHSDVIKGAALVGNPGCFAVSCILGLAPALRSSLVRPDIIICDAKTGVSGAGKKPSPSFHYPHRYDTINAYRIGQHQHVLEIERELTQVSGQEIRVTFTPHVVPMTRGILSTIYCRFNEGVGIEEAESAYREFYKDAPFVRVSGPGEIEQSCHVRGSNFCNLWLNQDQRTRTLIVVSHIDNLMKGQAGNAVQNMNIMFGFPETMGLMRPPRYP